MTEQCLQNEHINVRVRVYGCVCVRVCAWNKFDEEDDDCNLSDGNWGAWCGPSHTPSAGASAVSLSYKYVCTSIVKKLAP